MRKNKRKWISIIITFLIILIFSIIFLINNLSVFLAPEIGYGSGIYGSGIYGSGLYGSEDSSEVSEESSESSSESGSGSSGGGTKKSEPNSEANSQYPENAISIGEAISGEIPSDIKSIKLSNLIQYFRVENTERILISIDEMEEAFSITFEIFNKQVNLIVAEERYEIQAEKVFKILLDESEAFLGIIELYDDSSVLAISLNKESVEKEILEMSNDFNFVFLIIFLSLSIIIVGLLIYYLIYKKSIK